MQARISSAQSKRLMTPQSSERPCRRTCSTTHHPRFCGSDKLYTSHKPIEGESKMPRVDTKNSFLDRAVKKNLDKSVKEILKNLDDPRETAKIPEQKLVVIHTQLKQDSLKSQMSEAELRQLAKKAWTTL